MQRQTIFRYTVVSLTITVDLFNHFLILIGRQIAIDWAIPKQQYASAHNKPESIQKSEEQPIIGETVDEEKIEADLEEDVENENEDEEDSELDNEEEDSEIDNEEQGSDDESKGKKDWKGDNTEVERKSDVGEGKTLFIRNLDFSTTRDSLKNFMEQFGSVNYALLCMDKIMERPKGTGFVKFTVNHLFFLYYLWTFVNVNSFVGCWISSKVLRRVPCFFSATRRSCVKCSSRRNSWRPGTPKTGGRKKGT